MKVWARLFLGLAMAMRAHGPVSGAEAGRESKLHPTGSADPDPVQAEPFPSPRPGSSPTLFERMPGERTGITLIQQFPDKPSVEMLQDQRSGTGVCIGDYDRDGHPDVYISNYDRGNRLYRNLGQWRFEDVTEHAGVGGNGRWCGGTTFVDIDNDGDLDLHVCVFNAPNLLYINNGDGTFREQAKSFGLDFAGASVMGAFSDFDRDGWLDLYLVTARLSLEASHRLPKSSRDAFQRGAIQTTAEGKIRVSPAFRELFAVLSKGAGKSELIIAGQDDYLYRNLGTGSFVVVNRTAGIQGNHIGLAAIWWDYNDDGFPDLYVSNDYKGPDQLYRNNGDGSFTEVTRRALPCVPWSSMGTDVADINNDGLMDLLATDMAGSTRTRRVLNHSDPDKDRWFMIGADPQQYRRNTLFLNTGTDYFMEIAHLAGLDSTDWTWSPKFGDLDNDGWVDLFVSNGMSRDFINRDLIDQNERNGGWARAPVLRETNLAFRNLGPLQFSNVASAWGLNQLAASYGAALGDLDRDGDLDLVVCNFNEEVSVFQNTSATGHRVLVRLKGRSSNSWGIGATLKAQTASGIQSRYLTLARGFMSADEPVAHFGLGSNDEIQRLIIRWPSGIEQILENLAADRLYTISEPRAAARSTVAPAQSPIFTQTKHLAGVLHRETAYDDFSSQPLLPFKLSQLGPGLAWGDVNGDGTEDFYLGGATGQSGQLLLQQSDGTFRRAAQPAFEADKACEDMGAVFFEANGDGAVDLYVVSGGVEGKSGDALFRDRLYLNDGKGQFSKAPQGCLPDLRDSGSVVAAADFDRDGDLDLFVGSRCIPGQYPLPPISRLLRNDQGTFTNVTLTVAPALEQAGMVTSALWSDMDGDQWLDLFLTVEWGPVRLFHNRQGTLEEWTHASRLSEWVGWWNGIAGRDLNGDGSIDYVVSGLGLNTKYRATREQPALLLAGDFTGTGDRQLLEAVREGDKLFPGRGKNSLTSVLPFLSGKLPTFQAFATASVSDLVPAASLAKAQRFEANTFSSGALINDGPAGFRFESLPLLAQAAPGFGVVITEVDGDGNADVYLAQNFYPAQPETGRLSGGLSLLLRGRGDATFAPVWPKDSGLIVPQDARGLSTADLNQDRWPDFVVGINNGEVLTFQNNGSRENRIVTVRLAGARNNPTAIGSRVTVILSNGSQQTAEVYAGGGYLSQTTSELAFGLGRTNQVEQVIVSWPDGKRIIYRDGLDRRAIRLKQPQP